MYRCTVVRWLLNVGGGGGVYMCNSITPAGCYGMGRTPPINMVKRLAEKGDIRFNLMLDCSG